MRRLALWPALLLVAMPIPAWAQTESSTVTIVHGLPEFTADIYVNGELLLSGFQPEEATDPMELPADTYNVQIRDAGAPKNSDPALEADLEVPGGKNLSVIAHLDEAGEPTVSVFDNDLSRVPAGRARVLLRHQAEAPPVGLMVDGAPLLSGVSSGDEAERVIPAASHELVVADANGESLVSPTSVDLQDGNAYYLYLIGSSTEANLALMVQRVGGLESGPSGVATGLGGSSEDPSIAWWVVVLIAAAAVVAARAARDVARAPR
jgi:Domain of unknown function (DUF4397)